MTQHYEDFWNEAESIYSQEEQLTIQQHISRIKLALDSFEKSAIVEQTDILGEIIYEFCCITHKNNLDSAVALKMAIEKHKQQLLDPDTDDESY